MISIAISNKKAALYARLSRDDGFEHESNSIQNQKALLLQYAIKEGYSNYSFYVDDGISGTTMNRPGLNNMVEDIENGKISAVFVKDFSRLGRNYIGVGSLTDDFFPQHDVRFFSISENHDSDNGDDDIAPFRNVINE
jgi:Site-specific recombinases, DNA invertase Pin homologs